MCVEWAVGDYSEWCDLWFTCLKTTVQTGFAIAGAEVPCVKWLPLADLQTHSSTVFEDPVLQSELV